MRFGSVPENEWGISINNHERAARLHAPSNELIPQVSEQALQAATAEGICLCWEEAVEKPSYWRANIKIPIKEVLFDQLFNGRSGYRAQYYLSVEDGENFNRTLIDALVPAIKKFYEIKPLRNVDWAAIEASLRGQYSKIGVKNGNAYEDAKALITLRWKDSNYGSRLLKFFPPLMDVFGTFIKSDNISDYWVDDCKRGRSLDMHEKGFS